MGKGARIKELLLGGGLSYREIQKQVICSRSVIAYWARKLGRPPQKYTRPSSIAWAEIQAYYNQGHTIAECRARFGFSQSTWHNAKVRGDVVARAEYQRALPDDVVFSVRSKRTSGHVIKRALRRIGRTITACWECGVDKWLGCLPCLSPRNGG